jgi:diguanylate cyclase (GGDEF)-like protein
MESTAIDWQGTQVMLTISIGMAARRDGDKDASALLERADKALYAAKHEGRNRVCVAPAAFI